LKNLFYGNGHCKATGFALTAVGVENFGMTLCAKSGNFDILTMQPGFQELMSADCPKVKVILIHLKPGEASWKLMSPVAKFCTARPQRGSNSGDDVSGFTIKSGCHQLDCISQDVLDTATPAGMNYGGYSSSWIEKKYRLTIGNLDHH
jgi:hypothetical protein